MMGELTATFPNNFYRFINKQPKAGRLNEKYPYIIRLTIEEYNDLINCDADSWPQVNLWMQEECEGKILVIWGFFNVSFELEIDAMAFKLRWL